MSVSINMVNRREVLDMMAVGLTSTAGAGALARPANANAQDQARSPDDLPPYAVADGASHPLAGRFRSLPDARAVFPHAIALSDELDWCAVQGAIDAAAARGGGRVALPNTGRAYVLNRPLRINPNLVTLGADGATLDFRALQGAEAAILFEADGAPAYGHERHVFEGVELLGPGRDRPCAGFLFRTRTETLSSRAQLRDCTVHGFRTGALFGDRAYGIGFSHVSIYDCATCILAPFGLRDAGETVSFSQCYFFNSDVLIANPGSFDLKFFACSLDYARRLVADNNGRIDLVGCRLEIAPPTLPPIHCSGGRLNMFGGFFLINGARDAVFAMEIFAFSDPLASVHLFGVEGWNWRTTTGRLTNGPGRVHWYAGTEINAAPPGVRNP